VRRFGPGIFPCSNADAMIRSLHDPIGGMLDELASEAHNTSTLEENSMTEGTAHNAFHVILGLQVKGGFLDGVRIAFNDNLNCVIGRCQ
jgi:hypothetical protein